jgi:hypothetical protein
MNFMNEKCLKCNAHLLGLGLRVWVGGRLKERQIWRIVEEKHMKRKEEYSSWKLNWKKQKNN